MLVERFFSFEDSDFPEVVEAEEEDVVEEELTDDDDVS